MIIWVDDLRCPDDYHVYAAWVKSFSGFKSLLEKVEFHYKESGVGVEEIHLDHDLGDDLDGTGYDALLLIEEKLYFGKIGSLKTIYIHTSNPSAAQKMMSVKDVFKENYGVDVVRNNY